MILILVAIVAVFFAGSVCGIFALIVLGIHAEERRARTNHKPSTAGTVSRRLLTTRTGDQPPAKVKVGR
ncbi:hypothetical protein [Actinomadura gamaensis]|uniref:Secreted protein n=1 Tax=Actinomadura gamaensis TaxID=1763541 RepID=A0ABV9TY61_9ACTN